MPDLSTSLQKFDLGHLRAVAALWGLELSESEPEAACRQLCTAILDPELVREVLDSLPAEAMQALRFLARGGGRQPWAAFTRRFGTLREVGPARRDREQVYLHPVSTTEFLFYRALLGRAFFDTPGGLQEFAYLPDEFLPWIREEDVPAGLPLPLEERPDAEIVGRPASPRERECPLPPYDRLLDDAVTLLAALRMNFEPPATETPPAIVQAFLRGAGILSGDEPVAEKVRAFLEMPRLQALTLLFEAWKNDPSFDELRSLPALVCEGEWTNHPLATRLFLLGLLEVLPKDQWWSLPAFVRGIKEKYPDFQRPAGDYDSWFIKRSSDGVYLRGFESWDEVDGALIQYVITGPLYWLGRVDLAHPDGAEMITAFRRVARFNGLAEEQGKLHVSSQGLVLVPRSVPRSVRYQIARFCEWEQASADEYRYRVTPASLQRAARQGLKVGPFLRLLAKNAAAGIPPSLVKAIKRWEVNGTEARVEVQTVLRVSRPEVLSELRKSKAARFLGESLGPTAVIIPAAARSKILAALAELGLLAEENIESDIIARERTHE